MSRDDILRGHDFAASTRQNSAAGADLSGADHPVGPPLSSALTPCFEGQGRFPIGLLGMFIRRQILRAGVGPRVGTRAGEVRLRKEHMLGADWAGAGPDFDRRKGVRRSAFLAGLAAAASFASFLGLGTVLAADNANPNPNPNSGVTQPAPANDAADAKIKERERAAARIARRRAINPAVGRGAPKDRGRDRRPEGGSREAQARSRCRCRQGAGARGARERRRGAPCQGGGAGAGAQGLARCAPRADGPCARRPAAHRRQAAARRDRQRPGYPRRGARLDGARRRFAAIARRGAHARCATSPISCACASKSSPSATG